MIVLTANRINVLGHCEFRIEAPRRAAVTRDPVKAAKILSRMGVSSPTNLVDHAREWGSVEIVEGHETSRLRPD